MEGTIVIASQTGEKRLGIDDGMSNQSEVNQTYMSVLA